MLNQVVLMGRLTRDPELRRTPNGTPVASFTLAVERDFSSRETGEKQTDFIDIVAWRHTAEFVSKYFFKVQMSAVTGRLQIRDWTDRDGGKRRSAEVVAENVYFADSKRAREDSGDYSPRSGNLPFEDSYPSSAPFSIGESEFSELDDDDGDLPF